MSEQNEAREAAKWEWYANDDGPDFLFDAGYAAATANHAAEIERIRAALGSVRHRLLASAEISESGLIKYIEAALAGTPGKELD